ncbi:type VI secretion system amidase immunity protein Tai4 [Pseudomonas syringae]|uniref:type VI secretion system amidase immunity protein Tai4 n=1 Tax=Pseudomonas syringae TaxID=317 RepID=UPI001BD17E18|nr:type VI secretion system amidase immunity protein Tai4 [Pseudomonas syringae]MBS7437928.1 type VI secretion system amidase immunity protein Tai4 [Pseudomonas syringae]QVI69472.1 type VI secretion system amidase immunity protein Tai4 [Pseudomonas syringae]
MKLLFTTVLACCSLTALTIHASAQPSSPEGMYRTHAQNYKDMVLATCIASAYKFSANVGTDAGSSVTALREWTNYDWEKSPEKPREFVDNYLARDYTNPLVESEIKGVKFDLLKCLDLYHSKELDAQTKKAVINPTHTDVQDYKRP